MEGRAGGSPGLSVTTDLCSPFCVTLLSTHVTRKSLDKREGRDSVLVALKTLFVTPLKSSRSSHSLVG